MVSRVVGVDREAMLAVARQRTMGLDTVDIREGSLENLPVADGIADIAICMLVLHHIERPDLVLSEVCRVLKPSGHLLLLDMVAHDQESLRLNWGHRHLGFSEERLASDAQRAGLVLERYQPLPTSDDVLGPGLMVARFRPA